MSPQASEKKPDLQVLRGVAICSVLLIHLSITASVLGRLPFAMSNPLYAGVELFFVLSGFVVTQAALRGGYDPARFLLRRGFRLYPAMLAFLLVGLGVNTFYRHLHGSEWARGFFTVPDALLLRDAAAILGGVLINIQSSGSYLNAAMWSLSVEFQFYAVIALLLAAKRIFGIQTNSFSRLLLWLAASVLALCAGLRICSLFGIGLRLQYLTGWKFDFLAGGVVLALLDADKIRLWSARLPSCAPLLAYLLPLVVLSMVRSPLQPQLGADLLEGLAMPFALLCFVALVALGSTGGSFGILPRRLHLFLAWTGDRSYTLYLLHFPVLAITWSIVGVLAPQIVATGYFYGPAQLVVALALLLPLTELVYRCIELPAIAFGARILRRKQALRGV